MNNHFETEIPTQVPEGTKAMLFAAGMGTRLKPWTDNHPKALAPVNGKPLLQRNIEYLKSFGVKEFVVNVHHFAEQIIDFLRANQNFGVSITISHEKEEALETGGGLYHAKEYLQSSPPFLLMNADILTNLHIPSLMEFHYRYDPLVTLAVTRRESSRYFLFGEDNRLTGWKHAGTGEVRIARVSPIQVPKAFSGIHVIDPSLFNMMRGEGVYSLVDVYLDLARDHNILSYDHTGDILIDVGKPPAIAEAEKYFL